MASGFLPVTSGLDLAEHASLSACVITLLVPPEKVWIEGFDLARLAVRDVELDAVVGPPLSDETDQVAEVGLDDIAMLVTQTRIRLQ